MKFYQLDVNTLLLCCKHVYLLEEVFTFFCHIIASHIIASHSKSVSHRLAVEKVRCFNSDRIE